MRIRDMIVSKFHLMTTLTVLAISAGAFAEDIKLQILGGVPVVRCKAHYTHSNPKIDRTIPVNVIIDIGQREAVAFHINTATLLEQYLEGEEKPDGIAPRRVDREGKLEIILGDNGPTIKNRPVYIQSRPSLLNLTRRFAPQLGEIPIVATLGLTAFSKKFSVQLDLAAGVLRLMPKEQGTRIVAAAMAAGVGQVGLYGFKYYAKGSGYWIEGKTVAGQDAKVLLSTTVETTRLDASFAKVATMLGEDKPDTLLIGT
ncbi:MAG TPA: hypothetical protein ENL03_04630, partial [Phycisphaerae bacterium]|nr:hypothetical protein [Phycisphaerae bacterium]